MKKLLLISILTFAVVLTGCGDDNQKDDNKQAEDSVKKVEKIEEAEEKVVDEKKDDVINKELKATLASSTQGAVSDTIKITSIKDGDLLVSPALIEGEADIESSVVIVELRKSDHSLTSEQPEITVRDGKFKVSNFCFEFSNTKEGFVAVYDKENPENVVEIPVKFQTVK